MQQHAGEQSKNVSPLARSIAALALIPVVCFGLGTWSMYAAIPVLFFAILFVLPLREGLVRQRLHASLLFGTAMAWVLLPHSVLRFTESGRSAIETDIPGCQLMALAGFPLQQISAHGGGGWRLGYHLFSDQMWHAANCSILAIASWFTIARWPRRLWRSAHMTAWFSFLPMCIYGGWQMCYWWD